MSTPINKSFTDAGASWADSFAEEGALSVLTASFTNDSNLWGDSYSEAGALSVLTASSTDSFNLWSDAKAYGLGVGGGVIDNLNLWADSYAIGGVPIPLTSSSTDDFNLWADANGFLISTSSGFTDDLNLWTDSWNFTETTSQLSASALDDFNNWADSFNAAQILALTIAATDDSNNWLDFAANSLLNPPLFTDSLNLWTDSLNKSLLTSTFRYETFAQLKTQLANKLHDSAKVYWTDAELGLYLAESLRTFSLLTAFWRDQASFSATVGTSFYDITAQLPALIGRTVTDRNLINMIECHFQEAVTSNWPGGWTGTDMFTMDDIAHALQKRRNAFLAETGVLITRTVSNLGTPSGGRLTLPDTVIDIRRLARTNTNGVFNLWRVNEQELTAYNQTWSTPAAQDPTDYSIMSPPPITVQLSPAPTAAASTDILSVSTGDDFTPTTAATLVGVPDDMTWIVKWGAMADLLMMDGPAMDPARAEYCEQRYKHGVELVSRTAVITAARLASVPLQIAALGDLDAYRPGWQSAANAAPDVLATAGLNYIALSPPPATAISVTLDVIRNAIVPASDTDYIQIGREMLVPILDYAEHLAMFKVGGEEWEATNPGFEELMLMAENYNSRMSAASRIWRSLYNITNMEEPIRQRIATAPEKPQGQQ